MSNRRDFIKKTALGTIGLGTALGANAMLKSESSKENIIKKNNKKPLIISTWNHGLPANEETWKQLKNGKSTLDAIEAGMMIPEGDPKVRSVGYGGYPDREGHVTLDACIMDHNSDCGSVSFLEGIKHPISVAKRVLQNTPHVMLSGEGALQFALEQGFKKENLLTPESEKNWKNWLEASKYKPVINIENHDTISMLVIDNDGNISGGCTTSGAAWKMHGRVGDSPIIGAGLFLDNEVGAAAATGLGEAVIRTAGSAMVVELMRQGKSPNQACKEIVERIYNKHKNHRDMEYLQVGFIAVNKQGEYGGYSLRSGFNYAVYDEKNGNRMEDSKFKMTWDN
ncbi:isoaspartyl peptidase/L-asparaginase family protein [Wenyingzhuangia marina]|uniref:N4-(Beta-N-acetylglucosaminyl)-L-asparaginase n=1 Tax=Wenyingzhuangia marina TaxID=1195760 RepID=A0A1M5UBY1_9FLAO|nr:N(4)-(beta-N-acetylglucosaminyl)-L-asparaginase [Wenyingzhuangia marina]GGF68473.1 asparaginase [Wenyingzhuangia marina]SHH60545.1 N4-(beta-N-acetylglucosaminyl)-L-asparaginase [Wenyingzhuangia marina]